jgi:hypothetical protein
VDKERAALDRFGRCLVEDARDYAIYEAGRMLDGKLKGDASKCFYERVRATPFSAEQIGIIRDLIPDVVDRALHHMLWTVLGQQEWLTLGVDTDHGVVPDLKGVSDGLEGEYCEWVPRFSSERFNPALFSAEDAAEEFGLTFSRVSPCCLQRDPVREERQP